MSPSNKPDPRGFKPGANMPQDGYDPMHQGMSDSGNHATGHPGNDTPHVDHAPEQQGRGPARSDHMMRQENPGRGYPRR
jgi:hypothetical protein